MAVLILGGTVVILSPGLAEAILFRPSRGDPGAPPALVGVRGEIARITASDGVRIHGWWYPAPGEERGSGGRGREPPAVLLLHGNAGDISHRTPLARGLLEQGCSVFLLEYRGYGASGGSPSEEGLHLDAVAGLHFLADRGLAPGRIIVLGRSMGGAVAARLAAAMPVGGVILESAFTSLHGMARALYPFLPGFLLHRLRGRFDTLAAVEQISVPILVVHGTRDEIVPFDMGRQLRDAAGPGTRWYPVPGAGHNDVFWVGGEDYFRTLGSFIREVARAEAPE